MKKLIFVLALGLVTATAAEAQEIKTVAWDGFLRGIEFAKLDAAWDFVHDGRPIHEYTVVEVPAETLSVKHSIRLHADGNRSFHLVVTDKQVTLQFKSKDGANLRRDASIRIVFSCDAVDEMTCQRRLAELLRGNVAMQSLGMADSDEYEKSGVPPKGLILLFLMNTSGRFTR